MGRLIGAAENFCAPAGAADRIDESGLGAEYEMRVTFDKASPVGRQQRQANRLDVKRICEPFYDFAAFNVQSPIADDCVGYTRCSLT